MNAAQSILCVLSLLAGLAAGVWRGGSETAAPGNATVDAKRNATVKTAGLATGGTSQQVAAGKPDQRSGKPKQQTGKQPSSLEDLRRLLALDPLASLGVLAEELNDVLRRLPKDKAGEAVKLLWSRRGQPAFVQIMGDVAEKWVKHDPAAVLKWMQTAPGTEGERRCIMRVFAGLLASEQPQMLLGAITSETIPDVGDWTLGDTLPRSLAAKHPEQAIGFLAQIADAGLRDTATYAVARGWAQQDPLAAWKWTLSLPAGGSTQRSRRAVLQRMADKLPEEAVAMLRSPFSGLSEAERGVLLDDLGNSHADLAREFIEKTGLSDGMQWAAGLMADEFGESYTGLMAVTSKLRPGPARDAFVKHAVETLAEDEDLPGAWKMLETIPPSIERWDALDAYARTRAEKSVGDATAWLLTLPAGMDRDAAIIGFSRGVRSEHPRLAAEWLSSMSEPLARMEALRETFRSWHSENAAAAEAWLKAESKLSAGEKTRLRSALASGR